MERIIDYPEATEIANDDYVLLDGVTGGTKKFLAKNLGGVPASIERLCYINYVGNDDEEIPTINPIDTTYDSDYSEFLSYDSITKKFTVLKAFDALFVPWVYQYTEASSTRSRGQLFVNNTQLVDFQCGNTYEGTTAGKACGASLQAGDTFYSYTPSSDGYPQQRLKVYKVDGLTGSELNTALTYAKETV